MLRKFFGIIFMIYAIGMPIAFFKADNHKNMGDNLVGVIGVIVFEFIFLYFGIKLLKRKPVPQQQVYNQYHFNGDHRDNGNRSNHNNYSNYSSNTVIYSNHNTLNYTEINISGAEDKSDDDEKVDERPRAVSVSCPGCGAKVKVYRKQSADCEYCGITVEAP